MLYQQNRLVLSLQRSNYLLAYFILLHSFIAFNVLLLPVLARLILIILLVVYFVLLLKRYGWLWEKPAIQRLYLNMKGEVVVSDHQLNTTIFSLTHGYACFWFVILSLSSTDSRFKKYVFIAADAVEKDLYRQLNVYLADPKLFQQ